MQEDIERILTALTIRVKNLERNSENLLSAHGESMYRHVMHRERGGRTRMTLTVQQKFNMCLKYFLENYPDFRLENLYTASVHVRTLIRDFELLDNMHDKIFSQIICEKMETNINEAFGCLKTRNDFFISHLFNCFYMMMVTVVLMEILNSDHETVARLLNRIGSMLKGSGRYDMVQFFRYITATTAADRAKIKMVLEEELGKDMYST
jgi:hypothetical protein